MSTPKNWNAKNVINNISSIYKDIDVYFFDPIPYFNYADDMYKQISIGQIDVKSSVKEMLEDK